MSTISARDLFRINESILKRVNKELTYHGLETAYIVYKVLKKLNYNEKDIYTITSLAFLHDIGAYKTDIVANLEEYHIEDTSKHSIYGYELLKYTDLFKKEASIILYHHHSYEDKDMLIDNIPIKKEAFLIALADNISLISGILDYDEEKILNYISNIDKNRFKEEHVEALLELIEEGLIKDIISGGYRESFVKERSSNIIMSQSRLEKYVVLLPLSIDFFSFETSIHTVGVYCITRKLCEKLSLPKSDIESIKMGALLHDLGKVCIPKHILEKEGRLLDEEYEIMKKHVIYTKEILEDAKIDKDIIHLACSHHEKLNGEGYPSKLKEEELSIGDRIITISDIFCALTEKRHYKKAFSKDRVTTILLEMVEKGQIDIHITNKLIENYDEILQESVKERRIFESALKNMLKDYEKISNKMDELIMV